MAWHRLATAAGIAFVVACSLFPVRPIAGPEAVTLAKPLPSPSSSLPAESVEQPLTVADDVMAPELLEKVQPVYPPDARQARAQGRVILQATIDTEGSVTDLQILRQVDGFPSLSVAAMDAVRQWKYKPALRDGVPVRVYFTIVVSFTLRDAPELPQLVALEGRVVPVTLALKDTQVSRILEDIGKVTGIQFEFPVPLPMTLVTTVDWKEKTAREALESLADRADLIYEVRSPRALAVRVRENLE